jgi:hypothetical protein
MNDHDMYSELSLYTLQRRDPTFMHQHIVDAYAAQHPDRSMKPIRIAFALAGLYLHVEKSFTGKEVQNAHMEMGKEKREWPTFTVPDYLGDVSISDVLHAEPGDERDGMIRAWAASVWSAWSDDPENRRKVIELVESYPGLKR